MLQENNRGAVWIGATDQDEEGNWTWTDCSPWGFENWGMIKGRQQPANSNYHDGDGEDCAFVFGNKSEYRGWNDFPCNLKEHHFVCAKPMCSRSGEICCQKWSFSDLSSFRLHLGHCHCQFGFCSFVHCHCCVSHS